MIECNKLNSLSLNLQNCKLTYIHKDWLLYLENLNTLDVSNNYLTDFPLELFSLKNLKNLIIDSNLINKLPLNNTLIKRKSQIKILSLNNNNISKFPFLFSIRYLHTLNLQANYFTDFKINEKKENKNLKKLNLSHNKLSEFTIIGNHFNHLEILDLKSNLFNEFPSCICSLKSLKSLDISNNPITNNFPESISLLNQLEILDLSNIIISSNDFCFSLKNSIYKLKSLKELSLMNCIKPTRNSNHKDDFLNGIENLIQLNKLNLNCNELISFPNCIFKLVHLKVLSIAFNNITEIPTSLNVLSNLNHLDVRSNQISIFNDNLIYFGNLMDTEEFLFEGNPLHKKYLVNSVFPTCKKLFNILKQSQLYNSQLISIDSSDHLHHLHQNSKNLQPPPVIKNKSRALSDVIHYNYINLQEEIGSSSSSSSLSSNNNNNNNQSIINEINSISKSLLKLDDFTPILSLFFVGPPNTGKTKIIHSWFSHHHDTPAVNDNENQFGVCFYPLHLFTFENILELDHHHLSSSKMQDQSNPQNEFYIRVREFSGFNENDNFIFYDWFLKHTTPIFIVVWNISQDIDGKCLSYWMETSRYFEDTHGVIILSLFNDTHNFHELNTAKSNFLKKYPTDKYFISEFIFINENKISNQFSDFQRSILRVTKKYHDIFEKQFQFSYQIEQLLKEFNDNLSCNSAPFLNKLQFKELIQSGGISISDNQNDHDFLKDSIIYLHQTGLGIEINDNIILNSVWINRIFYSLINPSSSPSSLSLASSGSIHSSQNGLIESSVLLTRLLQGFPNSTIDVRCIIALLISSKVISLFQNSFFFPSVMEDSNCSCKKDELWLQKFKACSVNQNYYFNFIPFQMIHFLYVHLFSIALENLNYSCFYNMCLSEWTLKEPSGNFIFFRICRATNEIIMSSNAFSLNFEKLCAAATNIIRNNYSRYLVQNSPNNSLTQSGGWKSYK